MLFLPHGLRPPLSTYLFIPDDFPTGWSMRFSLISGLRQNEFVARQSARHQAAFSVSTVSPKKKACFGRN